MKKPPWPALLLYSVFSAGLHGLQAAPGDSPQILWRLGRFNDSAAEFNQGATGSPLFGRRFPRGELVYVVGKSTPAKDWPAFQPGSANGMAGFTRHPYTVQFDLPAIPQGLVTLNLRLLSQTPRAPRLEIELNGHLARYYRRPELNYAGGGGTLVSSPIAAAETVLAEIPPAFLRKGANRLVLTAVDDLAECDNVTNSGLSYDAIELSEDCSAIFDANKVTARVVPTIFYQRRRNLLLELVDVYLRSNRPLAHGAVTLETGGRIYTQQFSSQAEFGEQLVEFVLPEFPAHTPAEIEVDINGRHQRFPVLLSPARKWRLLVVPHEHLDIGFTDFQAKVSEVQSRVLDEAIESIQRHPEFRFSTDGYWCVEQFLAGRSVAQRARFLELVRERKIFVPFQEAALLTGITSLEVLIRSLYSGFQFNQEYGGSSYANMTDVPSYSWSYASILAAAGVKYFVAGSNNDHGPILVRSQLDQKSPFWWEGPDGSRILMWFSRGYAHVNVLFALPPFLPAGRDSLPIFLQAYDRPEYRSDSVIVYGTQGENTDLFPQEAELAEKWNQLYAYPSMQYSGFPEAMEHIAGQLGDSIPTVRGDGGPYWEDGNASDAAYVAMERACEQRALSAEKIATISALVNPVLQPDRAAFARLWRNMMLLDEHTWTSWGSVSEPDSDESRVQIATKEHFADQARMELDFLVRRYLAALADSISVPPGTLVVFNPLGWKRSGLMEFDLRKGYALQDPASKQEIVPQVLSTSPGLMRIRFLAADIPPVGYRCYAQVPARKAPPPPALFTGDVLESDYYRVKLDPQSGAVKTIFDKELGQELVNSASPYRFGQYLYVTGGDDPASGLQVYSSAAPVPELTIHGATGGHLVSVTKESFGTVAHLESSSLNTPRISTEIILFEGQKKILFAHRVRKTSVPSKEAVYFAFPFSMDRPGFQYDIQNGLVDPAHDQMPGAGKAWFSVQHWIKASQGKVSVALAPIDVPLVTLGDIVRGTWPSEFAPRNGTIFSYAMNNYTPANYRGEQGGEFTFRYMLTSGRDLPPESLHQFARGEMTPLEWSEVLWCDKALARPVPLPAAQASFVNIDQPSILLVAWKMAEDGDGMILRLLEGAGKAGRVKIEIPLLKTESAWNCTAMEQKLEPLPVADHGFSVPFKPFQILTVRVKGSSALARPS